MFNVEELKLLLSAVNSWDGWFINEDRSTTDQEDALLRRIRTKLEAQLSAAPTAP